MSGQALGDPSIACVDRRTDYFDAVVLQRFAAFKTRPLVQNSPISFSFFLSPFLSFFLSAAR